MADTVVKIGGDTTELTGALSRASSQVSSWGKGIKGTLTSSLAGVFAGAALANELREIVHEFANIEDVARRSDVSISFLLSIKQQAADTGTSLEEAAKAVKKFTIAANDAESGKGMVGVLEALGTNLEAVRAMKGEELFALLAKSVGSVSTQAERLQVLNILLGDASGKMESLLPLLQSVANDGVADVSDEMVKATKDAGELEDRLSAIGGGLKSVVLPALLGFLSVLEMIGYAIAKISFDIPFQSAARAADIAKNSVIGLWEAMKLNASGAKEYADKAAQGVKDMAANTRDELKKTVGSLEGQFNKAFGDVKIEDPIKAANEALKDQLKIKNDIVAATAKQVSEEKRFQDSVQQMKDRNAESRRQESLDKEKARIADLKKAEEKREADKEAHRENIKKEKTGLESELARLTGAKKAQPLDLETIGNNLKALEATKREGQQAVVSSRTAMGLGGGASALTVDPRRLEKLTENQLESQKSTEKTIIEIKQSLDGLQSALDES